MTSPQRFDQLKYRRRRLWSFRASELLRPGGEPALVGNEFHGRDGGPLTWTRDDSGLYVDAARRYGPVVDDRPRIHYITDPLTGKLVPSLLHEGVGTNRVRESQTLEEAAWTKNGGTTASDNAIVIGEAALSEIDFAATGSGGRAEQELSLAGGDGAKGVVFHIADHPDWPSTGLDVRVRDASDSSAIRFRTFITWSGGEPQFSSAVGTVLRSVPLASGVWRVEARTAGDLVVANNNVFDVRASGSAGRAYFGAAQVEDNLLVSSYQPTGASTATRPTDQLTRPREWSLADIEDGATWWFDVIHEGIFADTGATRRVYLTNDGATGPTPDGFQFIVDSVNNADISARQSGGTLAFARVAAATLATWAIGDRLRLAFRLIKDGAQYRLRIDYRRNDGSVVTGSPSSLFDLPTTLSGDKESFFSRGNGVDAANVAALAGALVQHTDGVPTFAQLEEEYS